MSAEEIFYNWFSKTDEDDVSVAWKNKVEKDYPYNRQYDYWSDIQRYEEAEYKKGVYDNKGIRDSDTHLAFNLMLKQIYFGVNTDSYGNNFKPLPNPEEVHYKRHYKGWLYFKWKEFKKDFMSTKNSRQGLPYYWITLNFNIDTPVDKLKYYTERFVRFKSLKNCKMTYTYEYYTENGGHPHAHILIEMNRTGLLNPSKLCQEFFQDKSVSQYMNNKEAFDYKSSKAKSVDKRARPREELKDCYLMGNKCEKKSGKVELDKEWRLNNNLENLYTYINE